MRALLLHNYIRSVSRRIGNNRGIDRDASEILTVELRLGDTEDDIGRDTRLTAVVEVLFHP